MTDPRLCIVCRRTELDATEAQTCIRCLGATRNALLEVVDLYAVLPGELADHAGAARPPDSVGQADSDGLPEALVLLAGGTAASVVGGRPTRIEPDGNRDHAADQWPTDTPSVLGVLATWEDDWRGPNVAQREATVTNCADYLLANMTRQAQRHPAFDEFAADMRRLRGALQVATRSGEHIERGVPCLDCGARLVRRYAEEEPCECGLRPVHVPWYDTSYNRDIHAAQVRRWEARHAHCQQGGRAEDWICSDRECGRIFDDRQYNFAVWIQWYQERASRWPDRRRVSAGFAVHRPDVGNSGSNPAART